MPHPALVAARLPRLGRRPRISSRRLPSIRTWPSVIPRERTRAPASAFAASFFQGRARCTAPTIITFRIHGLSPFSRNVTLSANRVPPSPSETPCKQEPFAPRSLPASSLLRLHPTPAPLLAQGQVSQVPVQNIRNAPCPYAPSRRTRRKTTSPHPCWFRLP